MSDRSESDEFRRQATVLYMATRNLLILAVIVIAALGWCFGGIWGLVIASVVSLVIASGLFVTATLLWVMSQDGA